MKNLLDWNSCQENSNQILYEGIALLKSKNFNYDLLGVISEVGNYLISHSNNFFYIGESRNLRKRLEQQFTEKTSTFFKNFTRLNKNSNLLINDFSFRYIKNTIGRKEIEDFGIVNIPTNLNKFHIGKREKISDTPDIKFWSSIQENFFEILKLGIEKSLEQPKVFWMDSKIPKFPGVYLIWLDEKIIYAGETSSLEERYRVHSKTTYFSALRRNVGTTRLSLLLKTKAGKKRYFFEEEDNEVTRFLCDCKISYIAVNFGRAELEESLEGVRE